MRRFLFLSLALAAAATGSLAASRESGVAAAPQTLAYGADPLQALDFWPGTSRQAPLVVFVHGGGWSRGDKRMMTGSAKLEHWQAEGYAVASLNYRLVPDATVEQQAQDVADALAALKRRAGELGIDPRRVVLVGHSAGAQLVALVGTDPAYLRHAGLDFGDLAGVVPLDGAAFDVTTQPGAGRMRMFRDAFGEEAQRQEKLSATQQAAAPNAANFLILHVQRRDGVQQSRALAEALEQAGTHTEIEGFSGRGLRGHMEINRKLGEPGYPATAVLDTFLARVFG